MEAKLKICSDCGKPSKLWRANPKLCKSCASKPKHQKKKKEEDIEVKDNLNSFFIKASDALVFPKRCENCNHALNANTLAEKRKHIAHILPKRPQGGFPIVGGHPLNKMYLCCMGGNYCHEEWDNKGAEERKEMFVYDLAIERFEAFKSLLNNKELIQANKYLNLD